MDKVNNTVLIIDDDPVYVRVTSKFLESNDFKASSAFTGEEGITALQNNEFDVVLIDKNLPDISGLDILKNHIPENSSSIIIMITAQPSVDTAVEAIQAGANNYVNKPSLNEDLLLKINKELEIRKLKDNISNLQCSLEDKYSFKNVIGESPQIKQIHENINQIKNSDISLLITGETGTGKGLLVEAIHFSSSRKNCPFITINVSTLSENILESELFGHVKGAFTGAYKDKIGLFQSAQGGTIFIDEIGDMPLKMQIKLLRVLQDRQFEPVGSTKTITTNVRIISATNRPLKELVESNEFREDLYYRINVVHFNIPPLRKRKDDIILLARHFVKHFSEKNNLQPKDLSQELISIFLNYRWPGNIRELENCIHRLVLLEKGQILTPDSLQDEIKLCNTMELEAFEKSAWIIPETFPEVSMASIMTDYAEMIEKKYLTQLLTKYKGYISKMADITGLDRRTISRKMHKYSLQRDLFK